MSIISDIYKKRREIAEGHINEFRSKIGATSKDEERVYSLREDICNGCPLKKGNACSRKLYIDPKTREVSSNMKPGYKRGCGCRLSAKQKVKSERCPANFWGGEFNN